MYRAAVTDDFKECRSLTLYLQQEAAGPLLTISLVCINTLPHLGGLRAGRIGSPRIALSRLTVAMGPGTQPGRDLETKKSVDLPSHILG